MNCKHCGKQIVRKPADPHNWYNAAGEVWCKATEYKQMHEPASPVARPGIYEGESRPHRVDEKSIVEILNRPVAQSGAGGELCPKCGKPQFCGCPIEPSSLSGQAAAPTPSDVESVAKKLWWSCEAFAYTGIEWHQLPIGSRQTWLERTERFLRDTASPTGGAEPPKMEISTKEYGNLLAIWQTALMLFGGPPDEFPDVERMRYRMHQATTPAATEPSAEWPSDLPANGIGAMNLLTNFWTGDLNRVTFRKQAGNSGHQELESKQG